MRSALVSLPHDAPRVTSATVYDSATQTVLQRFLKKVDKNGPVHPALGTPCWLWTASIRKNDGYGQFRANGTMQLAHRVGYELLIDPIPKGLEIDHLCRTRRCVNPDHLEPVTKLVNAMRGYGVGAINARKTTCPRGHPYDAANTRVLRDGHRDCRKCNLIAVKAYRARRSVTP